MKGRMLKATLGAIALASLAAAAVACGGGGSKDSSSTNQNGSQPQAAQQPAIPPKLYVSADTVRGSTGLPDDATIKANRSCVQESKFPLGSQIVWRARVFDPKTGQPMDDKNMASVQIKLSDGQVIDMKYGGHPGSAPVDSFWSGSFKVPTNYPTGALDYTVVATDKEGRTGQFNQFKVASAMLQIVASEPLASIQASDDNLFAAAR